MRSVVRLPPFADVRGAALTNGSFWRHPRVGWTADYGAPSWR